MGRRSGWAMAVVAAAALGGSAASAQMAPDAAAAHARAYRQVEAACPDDTARFCPAADRAASGHEQVLCLKTYRPDLSRACRDAVAAALR